MNAKDHFLYRVVILMAMLALLPPTGRVQPTQAEAEQHQVVSSNFQDSTTYTTYIPFVLYHTGEANIFGIEMETEWNEGLFDLAHDAGVDWVRRNGVIWNEIEAVEGTRDWSMMASLEAEMRLLRDKYMKMILIVRGVPGWAQTENGHACGPIAQDKFSAFADFMYELVVRYSQPPFNVHYWEIGNEPDFPYTERDIPFGCWGDSTDPYYGGEYYGEMLKVIYPAIKAADPQAEVLVGGLLLDCDPNNPPQGKDCTSSKFLEGILRVGGGSAFDGVSFHSYDYYNGVLGSYCNQNWGGASTTTGPILDLKAAYILSILQQYNVDNKYLMNTENALLCNNYACNDDFELTKAIYIAQSYADGLASNVSSVIWYSYTGTWQSTKLVNGVSNPLPAYYALQASSRIFDGMKFNQKISMENLNIYEFKGRGDRVWILWSIDGLVHPVTLPAIPVKMWDFLGNSMIPQGTVEVGISPIYLEWEN